MSGRARGNREGEAPRDYRHYAKPPHTALSRVLSGCKINNICIPSKFSLCTRTNSHVLRFGVLQPLRAASYNLPITLHLVTSHPTASYHMQGVYSHSMEVHISATGLWILGQTQHESEMLYSNSKLQNMSVEVECSITTLRTLS